MTFEDFQSSRTEIPDVRKAGRHGLDDSESGDPGYEYASGLYIVKVGEDWPERCRASGPCYLIIGNQEWIGELADLERTLYDAYECELKNELPIAAGTSEGLV